MDIEFGPDGSLYVVEWGQGFSENNPDSGVYRVDYISGARHADRARDGRQRRRPGRRSTVQFSSRRLQRPGRHGAHLPVGLRRRRHADVDGGRTRRTRYTAAGTYDATLTVTDESGATARRHGPRRRRQPAAGRHDRASRRTASSPTSATRSRTRSRSSTPRRLDRHGRSLRRRPLEFKLGHDTHAHELSSSTGCEGDVHDHRRRTATASTRTCSRSSRPTTRTRATARPAPSPAAPRRSCSPSSSRPSTSRPPAAPPTAAAPATRACRRGDHRRRRRQRRRLHRGRRLDLVQPVQPRGPQQVTFRVASGGAGGTIELRYDAPTARSWPRRRTSPRPAAGRRGTTSRSTCRRPSRRARTACSSCSATRRPRARC